MAAGTHGAPWRAAQVLGIGRRDGADAPHHVSSAAPADREAETNGKLGAERAEAIELRAEIEREMSVALRDGIETYSSPSGLDIIVNQVQIAKHADGSAMRLGDRMLDPNFTIDKDLRIYGDSDIDGLLNDQFMSSIEHINTYRTGLPAREI